MHAESPKVHDLSKLPRVRPTRAYLAKRIAGSLLRDVVETVFPPPPMRAITMYGRTAQRVAQERALDGLREIARRGRIMAEVQLRRAELLARHPNGARPGFRRA